MNESFNFFLPTWLYNLILYSLIVLFLSVLTYILINKKLAFKEKIVLSLLCFSLPVIGCIISVYYVKEFELIDFFKRGE